MISSPSVIRKGFTTLAVALLNLKAYLDSYLSQGIIAASLIQRFSRFKCMPKGRSKSMNASCLLSFVQGFDALGRVIHRKQYRK